MVEAGCMLVWKKNHKLTQDSMLLQNNVFPRSKKHMLWGFLQSSMVIFLASNATTDGGVTLKDMQQVSFLTNQVSHFKDIYLAVAL